MKGRAVQVVQVVQVEGENTYLVDEEALRGVLLRGETRELPVVALSLAGAYRGGKSFLLNFLIRYLSAPVAAREDGSWLGAGCEPLEGFSWRGGSKRNTTGILLWSEPIVTTLPTGEKVAVLLMDTQGASDRKGADRESATIFALSTLLSSVLIYNLPGGNIQSEDLQRLQLFTEYGKMVKEQEGGGAAFQVLQFLVRDWPNSFEFAYGSAGGQAYLDEVLNIEQPKDMSDPRLNIGTSFEKVSCFLMPHPGFEVQKPEFTGSIEGLEQDFLDYLHKFASTIFGPKTMKIKKIHGRAVKARELGTYFSSYTRALTSKQSVSAATLMQATAQAGLLLAATNAREQYEARMNAVCAEEAPGISSKELNEIHLREKQEALAAIQNTKIMLPKEDIRQYLHNLSQEIDDRLPKYVTLNSLKIEGAISEAKKVYEERMLSISGSQPLCVRPATLKYFHDVTLLHALHTYDTKRINNGNDDDDKTALIESLNEQYAQLMRTNVQNNKAGVQALCAEYRRRMEAECGGAAPPPRAALQQAHARALAAALQGLQERRSGAHSDTGTDEFKDELVQQIMREYEKLQKFNEEKLKLIAERQQEQNKAQALELEIQYERERAKQIEEELELERKQARHLEQVLEREQALQQELALEREQALQQELALEREQALQQELALEREQALQQELALEREQALQQELVLEREQALQQELALEREQALQQELALEREQALQQELALEREQALQQELALEREQALQQELALEREQALQQELALEREQALQQERVLEREQALQQELALEREQALQQELALEREQALQQELALEREQALQQELALEREQALQQELALEREQALQQELVLEREQALQQELALEREQALQQELALEQEQALQQELALEREQALQQELALEREQARHLEQVLEREQALEREREIDHYELLLERQPIELLQEETPHSVPEPSDRDYKSTNEATIEIESDNENQSTSLPAPAQAAQLTDPELAQEAVVGCHDRKKNKRFAFNFQKCILL